MFEKLLSYYSQALLLTEPPNFSYYAKYHWFKHDVETQWIGIPFESIQPQELSLLKTLFRYEVLPFTIHPKAQKWYEFLYLKGDSPPVSNDSAFRCILFHFYGTEWEQKDLEEAIYGYFSKDLIILWEDQTSGVMIEENPTPKISEGLFLSLRKTLESDFFIKSYFYSDKMQPITNEWPVNLDINKQFFEKSIKLLPAQPFHTFEKLFPFLVSEQLTADMQEWLRKEILVKISDEPELLTAVKRFLENNSNATLTAKELYIHRNTLQYRLDKFVQKTGIHLKDFHSAMTVYLACLLSEAER